MSKSNLRKKFFRGEKKISSQIDEVDATTQIDLIKSRPKKEELPPPLPMEKILSHRDTFINEISNSLNRNFTSVLFNETNYGLENALLTIDCLFAVLKIIGNLDSYLFFKKESGCLLVDCSQKDVFFRISFEIEYPVDERKIKELAENLSQKINVFLSPYGSHCTIRETIDLIQQKRHLAFMVTLNRIELFSLNESYEQSDRQERSAENVL